MLNQIVVTAASGHGAKVSRAIKHFEDDPGIIGESADDPDIDIDEFGEPTIPQTIDKPVELFALSALAQNFQYKISELTEFLYGFLARFAPEFVDYL